MKCRSCSFENRPDSRVCDHCGKALIDNPPPVTPSKRPATRGEKIFGVIAGYLVLIVGVALLGKLTGSFAITMIGVLLIFGSGPVVLRLLSPKTKAELAGEVIKGEIQEAKDLRSIGAIQAEIARLESEGGNGQEIWKLHRRVAGMYDLAFTGSFAMFDRITDGNLTLSPKGMRSWQWMMDHADIDKDRQWVATNMARQQRQISKWRLRRKRGDQSIHSHRSVFETG